MTDDEQDLRWYYTSAAADCGMRSTQGGFEFQMAMRANCAKASDNGIHVHETRSSHPCDGLQDRQLDAARRMREVGQRLARLTLHDQRVLELAFGDAHTVGPVSLALVAAQPGAVKGHARALLVARRVLVTSEAAARVRAKRVAGTTTKARRLPASFGVREWLMWVAVSNPDALAMIIGAAVEEQRAALAAYVAAGREAA